MKAARAGALGWARAGALGWALTVVLPMRISLGLAGTTSAAPATLQDCAVITDASTRLSCYDRLAARAAAAAGAPSAAATARPAPVAGAPATTPALTTAGPGTVPPANPESFGKYQAEHPQAPAVAPQLEAQVLSVGASSGGRTTVTLEGGAVWELNEADPLLVVGDTVTITRAALGSYLMQTPEKRLHRVRRLR
jgi:hypothetical protein